MMGTESMPKYWLPWLVGMPAEQSRAACCLVFGGVLERLPKLKVCLAHGGGRSEEPSELQSLMRISYAVFCLKKKKVYKYKRVTKAEHEANDRQEHNHQYVIDTLDE